ncbi:MAG: 8-oxo-dGTP pyrophosphatase MutT (NUDIX family) [Candidatus Nanohaloarchaea archaeon]
MKDIIEVATAVPYDPEKDKFLIAKRTEDTDIHPGKWNFPGGKIEDEKPGEAVLRELKEETGLLGEIIRSGGNFILDTEDGKFDIYPFLVTVDSEPDLNPEHTDYRWIKPEELDELETVKGLKKDLKHVGVTDE